MASIGEQLQTARKAKGLSVGQVAEATRIKPTHIEAMECDNFCTFASPIYARGFIKLFAECVEIDPAPLLEAYHTLAQPAARPMLKAEDPAPVPSRQKRLDLALASVFRTGRERVKSGWSRLDLALLRQAGLGLLAVLILGLGFAGIRGLVRRVRERPRHESRIETIRAKTVDEERFPLLKRPPPPYVDSDSFGRSGGDVP